MRKLRPLGNALPTQEFLDQLKEAVEQIRGNRRSNVAPLQKAATLAQVRNTLNALLAQIQGDEVSTLQEPSPWISPTLINSWANYDPAAWAPAGFYKDALGIVHLRGLLKSGTFPSIAFYLPVGYRPIGNGIFTHLNHNGTAYQFARVDVQTDGGVEIGEGATGTSSWSSIEGITFLAER
jgi:hypothetical protein